MVNMKRNDFIQEIFNKVSKHLLKQNSKSIDLDKNRCMFKFNGLEDPVGCLIPNRDYLPEMERFWCASSMNYFGDTGYSIKEINFIDLLQQLHDCYEPKCWLSKLKKLAKSFNLEFKGTKK